MPRPFHLIVLLTLVTVGVGARADVPNSADHPLIKRYEGSTIVRYSRKAFAEYELKTGPVEGQGSNARFPKTVKLEGQVTRITYLVPVGRSPLEVMRNYELELKKAGFATLFSGGHEALGQGKFDKSFAVASYQDLAVPSFSGTNLSMLVSYDDRYLAAKLSRPQGDLHVALYTAAIDEGWGKFLYSDPPNTNKTAADGQVIAQLDVVEAKPMETKMVTVSAGEMAAGIASAGSIALYGILFDTNSATVKPESMATIEEVSKLLKEHPTMRLLVVGHTDNVGTFEFNMDLSQRRAASVVQVLTSKLGVDPKRLTPVGVSFASPVASSKTEEGRAKNRRVQLVENVSSPGR
jgi:OmpA-OmpF porin, OOP family